MEKPKEKTLYEEGLGIRFDTLEQLLKQCSRRIDVMQKSLDLLFADRALLEDIIIQLGQAKSMVVLSREHQEGMIKVLQADVTGMKSHVTEGLEDITQSIDEKDMVTIKDKGLMDKLRTAVTKK